MLKLISCEPIYYIDAQVDESTRRFKFRLCALLHAHHLLFFISRNNRLCQAYMTTRLLLKSICNYSTRGRPSSYVLASLHLTISPCSSHASSALSITTYTTVKLPYRQLTARQPTKSSSIVINMHRRIYQGLSKGSRRIILGRIELSSSVYKSAFFCFTSNLVSLLCLLSLSKTPAVLNG